MKRPIEGILLREGKSLVRFLIVGGASFLIYSGTYILFTRFIFPLANLTLLNTASICASASFNFTAHRLWTYRATHSASRDQVWRYIFVVIISVILQSVLFWIFVEYLRIPDLFVLLPIAGICALFTYFAHQLFTFRSAKQV